MAEVSDTVITPHGEQEGNVVYADINTWLSKHRLNKFKQYFQENEVILEDLLTYNEDEMNSVITECQITATAYKKRFKDSIRQLQFESNQPNIPTASSSNQIYRIVMSIKESEVMDQLKEKLLQINKSIEDNKNETDKLSNTAQHIEHDIKSVFSEIRAKTDEREKALMIQLNDIANDHSNKLKTQKNYLDQYQNSVETAMKEQNSLLLDPVMDSKKRQSKIEQIANNTLNNINDNTAKLTLKEIRFIMDHKSMHEFISNIGVVTIKREQDPPNLKISKIEHTEVPDDEIKYHLKYKVADNNDNDDDKKVNLTEMDIIQSYWMGAPHGFGPMRQPPMQQRAQFVQSGLTNPQQLAQLQQQQQLAAEQMVSIQQQINSMQQSQSQQQSQPAQSMHSGPQSASQPTGQSSVPTGQHSESELAAGGGRHTSVPMLEVNPLTAEMLQDLKPSEMKRLIGERLFPQIQTVEPRLAGKITGMLLEMDNTELLVLLSEKRTLMIKINESLAVLKDHQQKQSMQNPGSTKNPSSQNPGIGSAQN